jgi:hypothetical protein
MIDRWWEFRTVVSTIVFIYAFNRLYLLDNLLRRLLEIFQSRKLRLPVTIGSLSLYLNYDTLLYEFLLERVTVASPSPADIGGIAFHHPDILRCREVRITFHPVRLIYCYVAYIWERWNDSSHHSRKNVSPNITSDGQCLNVTTGNIIDDGGFGCMISVEHITIEGIEVFIEGMDLEVLEEQASDSDIGNADNGSRVQGVGLEVPNDFVAEHEDREGGRDTSPEVVTSGIRPDTRTDCDRPTPTTSPNAIPEHNSLPVSRNSGTCGRDSGSRANATLAESKSEPEKGSAVLSRTLRDLAKAYCGTTATATGTARDATDRNSHTSTERQKQKKLLNLHFLGGTLSQRKKRPRVMSSARLARGANHSTSAARGAEANQNATEKTLESVTGTLTVRGGSQTDRAGAMGDGNIFSGADGCENSLSQPSAPLRSKPALVNTSSSTSSASPTSGLSNGQNRQQPKLAAAWSRGFAGFLKSAAAHIESGVREVQTVGMVKYTQNVTRRVASRASIAIKETAASARAMIEVQQTLLFLAFPANLRIYLPRSSSYPLLATTRILTFLLLYIYIYNIYIYILILTLSSSSPV